MSPAEATQKVMSALNEELHSLRNQLLEATNAYEILQREHAEALGKMASMREDIRRLERAPQELPEPENVPAPPRRRSGGRKRSEG